MVQNADIILDNVVVPDSIKLAERELVQGHREGAHRHPPRRGLAGGGQQLAAYEVARRYAAERTQFGRPIGAFQLVQDLLVKILGNAVARMA